jgi:hypothetical protein
VRGLAIWDEEHALEQKLASGILDGSQMADVDRVERAAKYPNSP